MLKKGSHTHVTQYINTGFKIYYIYMYIFCLSVNNMYIVMCLFLYIQFIGIKYYIVWLRK